MRLNVQFVFLFFGFLGGCFNPAKFYRSLSFPSIYRGMLM